MKRFILLLSSILLFVIGTSDKACAQFQNWNVLCGTYSFTDKDGESWKVVLKSDKTALLYCNGQKVDHGKWIGYGSPGSGVSGAKIVMSSMNPKIAYPAGYCSHSGFYIRLSDKRIFGCNGQKLGCF